MLDSTISWLTVRAGYTFSAGEAYPRMGNKLTEYVPYGVFSTAGSPIAVVVVTDDHWARLCEVIGHPELADVGRFATTEARREHREELEEILTDAFQKESSDYWFDELSARQVPASPISDTAELWEDEHVSARELLTTVEDGDGRFKTIQHPVKFERAETDIRRGVPQLGEHTREALEDAGYSETEIDEFENAIQSKCSEA